ncbi:hypothetical protein [Streptomyces spirodelae]|uniref:hypothetical protein n=1 Tax=Streptomyces spirodelae TaxID=2812904 RepID=UPI0027DBFA8A|nr:hypothetical protein [Streptomyces spirodelae]
MYRLRPVANGLRTDHPVPDLPFADDSHIPLDDGPAAIEAVGRNVGHGMWGRFDKDRSNGSWRAFTTDPLNHDLGWVVRYHPEHGRTVLLMHDKDISPMHTAWWGDPLLFRAGGYWWDGKTWYRPGQIWDPVSEDYERRPAKAAVTVTAADLLDGSVDLDRAYVAKVASFDPEAPAPGIWLDHLALWAQQRMQRKDTRSLDACVVNLSCPELAGDQLIGVPEMAALAEIGASTLRGYISRGESSVPLPQATVSGRAQWSKPVARDWAEARRRSWEGVEDAMSAGDPLKLSPGAAQVRERFAKDFAYALWERPDWRKRWVLRHRNKESVQEIADVLARDVAVSLEDIVPTEPISATIRHAVLDEFADGVERHRNQKGEEGIDSFDLPLLTPIAKMLDWFIRHHPAHAQATIGDILREAHNRWQIPASVTGQALRRALVWDGKLDKEILEEYLNRVLPSGPVT